MERINEPSEPHSELCRVPSYLKNKRKPDPNVFFFFNLMVHLSFVSQKKKSNTIWNNLELRDWNC